MARHPSSDATRFSRAGALRNRSKARFSSNSSSGPVAVALIQRGRLGMGGGFYDRTLAGVNGTVLIGLAHACQEVGTLPLQDWDVRLDYVATDAALHHCRG